MLSAAPALAPTGRSLLVEWHANYLLLVAAGVLAVSYLRTRIAASKRGIQRARRRDVVFFTGVAALVWTTNCFPQARSFQLMWVWMTQSLLLLLIVPMLLMAAQPLSLVSAVHGPDALLLRLLRTRTLRFLGSPLLSPLLVPVLCLLLVFSGVGEFSVSSIWAAGLVQLVLLASGMLIALPLVTSNDERSSLAVGLSLAIGFVELILDAFPGIALRFQTHVTISHFAVDRPAFSRSGIADQNVAGGILWVVAEVLDLPFLILAANRWIRADARDAARIDAELDAQSSAWQPRPDEGDDPGAAPGQRPWWLDDPELRDRFRRR